MNISDFIEELNGFAVMAEETLDCIEKDQDGNTHLFSVFSEKMFTIKGTAQQLGLGNIADFASMAEEIAIKGAKAPSRAHVRKCIGCLWDALTTIKYLLEHKDEKTNEEQSFLFNRLEATLKSLGGRREIVAENEIEELLKQQKK